IPDNQSVFRVEIARGRCLTPELRSAWQALTGSLEHPESLHHSLGFYEHLKALDSRGCLGLAAIRNGASALAGIIPFRVKRMPFVYQLRERVLGQFSLPGVEIIGGLPQMPANAALCDLLFKTLGDTVSACDVLAVANISTRSLLRSHITDNK